MHLHLKTNAAVPIGSIIESVGPPDSKWHKCDGAILDKADYVGYVSEVEDLHPMEFTQWEQFTAPQVTSGYYRFGISIMGNTVVAVGRGNQVWVSTDSGETWSMNTNLPGNSTAYHYGIVNNGTYFVTAEYGANYISYSSDGVTWNNGTGVTTSQDSWKHHAYGNNIFLICHSAWSSSTNVYITSTNGTTWTERNAPWDSCYVTAVFYDGTEFLVYVSYSGPLNCKIYRSSDGINWTSPSGAITDFLHGNPEYNDLTPYCFFKHDNDLYMIYDDLSWCLKYIGTEKTNPLHWEPVPLFGQARDGYWYMNSNSSGHGVSINNKGVVIPRTVPGMLVGSNGGNMNYHKTPFSGLYCFTANSNYIIGVPYVDSTYIRNIVKSVGITQYDTATQFQLPNYQISKVARINYYIKVLE